MIRFLTGTLILMFLLAPLAWSGGEERHSHMVDEICARPRHFYRMHGIRIMPEACDR